VASKIFRSPASPSGYVEPIHVFAIKNRSPLDPRMVWAACRSLVNDEDSFVVFRRSKQSDGLQVNFKMVEVAFHISRQIDRLHKLEGPLSWLGRKAPNAIKT